MTCDHIINTDSDSAVFMAFFQNGVFVFVDKKQETKK